MDFRTYVSAYGKAELEIGQLLVRNDNPGRFNRRTRQARKFRWRILGMYWNELGALKACESMLRLYRLRERNLDGALILPKKDGEQHGA